MNDDEFLLEAVRRGFVPGPKGLIPGQAIGDFLVWDAIATGDKNELIKLVHKSIRHGFGDHPEMITDMAALSASIAKRLAGELWARRKKR